VYVLTGGAYDYSVDLDGLILEKPADEDEAFTMVKSLSGLTLFLYIRHEQKPNMRTLAYGSTLMTSVMCMITARTWMV
jgi:hypothetical protein